MKAKPSPTQTMIEKTIAESIVAEHEGPIDFAEIDPRVLAGMRFLDTQLPGWALLIDLGYFDLSCGDSCVLGQLYSDYENGLETLWGEDDDVREKQAADKGFFADGRLVGYSVQRDSEWDKLNGDWKLVIAERQLKSLATA